MELESRKIAQFFSINILLEGKITVSLRCLKLREFLYVLFKTFYIKAIIQMIFVPVGHLKILEQSFINTRNGTVNVLLIQTEVFLHWALLGRRIIYFWDLTKRFYLFHPGIDFLVRWMDQIISLLILLDKGLHPKSQVYIKGLLLGIKSIMITESLFGLLLSHSSLSL